MSLLSVCSIVKPDFDYSFLELQDWSNCELVMGGNEQDLAIFTRLHGKYFESRTLKLVIFDTDFDEGSCIYQSTGQHVIWLGQEETWDKDFVGQMKSLIENNREATVYGLGFCRNEETTTYCLNNYPILKKPFALARIVRKPSYFVPCVKWVWKRKYLNEFGLVFDRTIEDGVMRLACFNLDYMIGVYEENGFVEPRYVSESMSFVSPLLQDNKFINWIYREKVENKREIWLKNPWNKAFWIFLVTFVRNY
jgi:hypothetical protein